MSTDAQSVLERVKAAQAEQSEASGAGLRPDTGHFDVSQEDAIITAVVEAYPESDGFELNTAAIANGTKMADGRPGCVFAWKTRKGVQPVQNITMWSSGKYALTALELPESVAAHFTG